MGDSSPVSDSQVGGSPVFATTEWSVVLHAADGESTQADQALERLCRTYWYPLYAYVRRRGYNPHEAQDLTQAFFERMLEKSFLRAVDRSKGKFRSFLIAALEHFLAKDWRRAHAQKRGGHAKFLSLDDESPEQQYLEVSTSALTPEQVYDQQWVITLLEQVLQKLSAEFDAAGKAASFAEMKIFLTGEKRAASYGALAEKLGTTEAALKMAVSRMRQRYGELLRAEIAQTVSGPDEVEEELRALFTALSL
ncbi:MAG TPA: sigma-70 family RNA polymerase sigma factor [Verrucomicrobiae bacterium]|nr:sigma-70 family RNA polymerase sigma factor [Verrucomicrobiae bacterium]